MEKFLTEWISRLQLEIRVKLIRSNVSSVSDITVEKLIVKSIYFVAVEVDLVHEDVFVGVPVVLVTGGAAAHHEPLTALLRYCTTAQLHFNDAIYVKSLLSSSVE